MAISEQDRALIKNVRVQDGFSILTGGPPLRVRQVTYNVGEQGPFTYQVPWGQFTLEKIYDEWAKQIALLRALGLV